MSLNKLLIISGPTATGKTSLALKIAQQFNGELISADSRQIYKGMDIGTGKDHPKDTQIHLIDIINPNQSFSVAQYRQLAIKAIKDIQGRGKLPIIVGGTGQYLDSIIKPQPTFTVKPNNFLRYFLNKFPLSWLQKILRYIDVNTFNSLNNSDLHNPHRLIRKIEIALSLKKINHFPDHLSLITDHYLHLSLTAPNDLLYSRIDQRVDERLKMGLLDEIKNLLKKYSWHHPGLNTLAYKEFRPCFPESRIQNLESCITRWKYDEHAYARRQKTWFKKINPITFIDITQSDYKNNVFTLINNFLSS